MSTECCIHWSLRSSVTARESSHLWPYYYTEFSVLGAACGRRNARMLTLEHLAFLKESAKTHLYVTLGDSVFDQMLLWCCNFGTQHTVIIVMPSWRAALHFCFYFFSLMQVIIAHLFSHPGCWRYCTPHHGAEVPITCAGVQTSLWAGDGGKCTCCRTVHTYIVYVLGGECSRGHPPRMAIPFNAFQCYLLTYSKCWTQTAVYFPASLLLSTAGWS